MRRARQARVIRALRPALAFAIATILLAGCEPVENARPTATGAEAVSVPVPLPEGPPIVVSDLPPEDRAPLIGPSNAPLPPEADVLTSGQVLERLRARLSQPTCIVGPNNTRWRHKYAGYPQHFADEIVAILPRMLVVLDELETHKLPGEFAMIPIVESWYRPDVHSFGGASGMWQMLAETARNNGATVTGGYDGRLSTLDATDAAMNYLDKLQAMFNDWRLTAMAYNSGEYRLAKTMSPDELAARGAGGALHYRRPGGLAFTTYEYVSKMRALICMLDQPQRQEIPFDTSVPITHWVRYTVPADVDSLDELAQRLGTDAGELKAFNSGFRNGRIGDDGPRTVLVPASTRSRWTATAPYRLAEPPPPAGSPSATTPMPVASDAAKRAATSTRTPTPGSFHAPVQAISGSPNGIAGQPSTTSQAATGSAPPPEPPARTAATGAQPATVVPAAGPARVGTESNPTAAAHATAAASAAATIAPSAAPQSQGPQAAIGQPVRAPVPAPPATALGTPTVVGTPGGTSEPGSTSSPARPVATPARPSPPSEPHSLATGPAPSTAATAPVSIHEAAVQQATESVPAPAAAVPAASTAASGNPQAAAAAPATMPKSSPASAPGAAATTPGATAPALSSQAPAAGAPTPSPSTTSPVAVSPGAPTRNGEATMRTQPPAAAARTYKVQFGDSIESIAARYGVKAADLRAWNHMASDAMLYVDQVLTLEP